MIEVRDPEIIEKKIQQRNEKAPENEKET
jgi:hypothetical protein